MAHLGYFREELVNRRRWVDEAAYADLIALSQFLPGPGSSQLGFALGMARAGGLAGGVAAWLGFTLPSAFILLAFAFGVSFLGGPIGTGSIHGLKLVAVAVVAHAAWGMARTLTPDRSRIGIALGAIACVTFFANAAGQLAAIVVGLIAGLALCRQPNQNPCGRLNFNVSRKAGAVALTAFAAVFFLSPLASAAADNQLLSIFDAFYRSGSLVFGGGHVVLPLLEAEVVTPGWVSDESFLAGYGVAQAIPGPLFTFAAYLGALAAAPYQAVAGSATALAAIFLPGILLMVGMLPFWDALRSRPTMQAAMRGANAAVVGILAAALYDPVWTSSVHTPVDFLLALAGVLMLSVWKLAPWIVVASLAVVGALFQILP